MFDFSSLSVEELQLLKRFCNYLLSFPEVHYAGEAADAIATARHTVECASIQREFFPQSVKE